MQVESDLFQGFLRTRGGQVEADKLLGGVTQQQPLTLQAGTILHELLRFVRNSETASELRVSPCRVSGL